MIPEDYLRNDMWVMLQDFPKIENIEEYNCPHQWWCDCGTDCNGAPLIYFCHWCCKKKEVPIGDKA